jgi:hypothetical protein
VIRIATDDPTWGHRRVPGELLTLGHRIAASTVWQILQDARINPAPRRAGPTWRQLLAAQARGIRAAGFVHVDTVLLRRTCARIVIGHGTRRAHLAGVTARPDGSWTTQAARTFLTGLGQRAACLKFLIRDRAGPFTGSFDAVFAADGTTIVPSPPGAPTGNAAGEPMIGTLRREALDRLLTVGEQHLRRGTGRIPAPLPHTPPAPHPGPGATGSSPRPATADRPRRAPGPPQAGPRRPHARVSDRRLTSGHFTTSSSSQPHSRIRAPQGLEFLPGGQVLAAAEPVRRGGGSAGVVNPSG